MSVSLTDMFDVSIYQSVQEIEESVLTIQLDQVDQPSVMVKSAGSKSYVLSVRH